MSTSTVFSILGLAATAAVLVQIWRFGIKQNLPWFVYYVSAEFLTSLLQFGIGIWFQPAYAGVFWLSEIVLISLALIALRESFTKTLVGFNALWWFPWLIHSVWIAMVLYAIIKAIYFPPVHASRIVSVIIGVEFGGRWIICLFGLVFLILVKLFEEKGRRTEVAIIMGLSVSSIGFLVSVLSRSVFGTKFPFVTRYAAGVAYLGAAFLWIRGLAWKPAEPATFESIGITPEQMTIELARYREILEKLLRNSR